MARKRVKVVFRSNPVIMTIVLVAVICSTIAVVALQNSLDHHHEQYELLRQRAAILEATNEELANNIADLGSVDSAIKIAEDELGLVDPEDTIFAPTTD